jgi:hypothetical protein
MKTNTDEGDVAPGGVTEPPCLGASVREEFIELGGSECGLKARGSHGGTVARR